MFVEVILPLVAVIGLGAWVGSKAGLPLRPLSTVAFRLFAPALVLNTLTSIEVSAQLIPRIVAAIAIGFVLSAAAGYAAAGALRLDRSSAAATSLCAALPNIGNMGMPVAALAFGAEGLEIAVVAFVTQAVLTFVGGVGIASLGVRRLHASLLLEPLRVPSLWVVPPGILLNVTQLSPPVWIGSAVDILAGAAIPVMLVVLGLSCAQRLPSAREFANTMGATGSRLLLGPVAAIVATSVAGLGGLPQQTLILLGGMPTAVMASIIASQYGTRPDFVSRTVVVSTFSSLVTLTVLLSLVR